LRPAVQALFFQVLRSLARAQGIARLLAARRPPPQVDALLCVALALAWRREDAPYTGFTLVNQTVEATKRQHATAAQAGFVNGCLRRFLREQDALVGQSDQDDRARWNHPPWWISRLQRDHPVQWQAVLQADTRQAPMVLRVNARRSTAAAYRDRLQALGMPCQLVGRHGVLLQRALPVHEVPGFDEGEVSVQDAAGQMAAELLLGDGPAAARARPLRVLDACAAPGGKTAHLLELADAEVLALDIDPVRCQRIVESLSRLGLQARVVAADAAAPGQWWDGVAFDAILLDAPCTASGIVRRHPDVPWLRRESDIAQLAKAQARLLASLWPLLAPGGRMVYCTCSVFRAEGSQQIETFLAHNTDARLLPSPGHLLPVFGANGEAVPDNRMLDHDGFFYALLEKLAA
jgi:16S rRNA (cytosine967-C5)-methyltransferase